MKLGRQLGPPIVETGTAGKPEPAVLGCGQQRLAQHGVGRSKGHDLQAATILAGCDGASSTVREQLAIGFPGGTYEGLFYVADVEGAGGTSPPDASASVRSLEADYAHAWFKTVTAETFG